MGMFQRPLYLFLFLVLLTITLKCFWLIVLLVEICHTTLIDFKQCPTLDSSFSSSSQESTKTGPEKARFNSTGAWIPDTDDENQWVMVDLVIWDYANSVLTKGLSGQGSYVKSFTLEYSMDGIIFESVMEGADIKASICGKMNLLP